MSFIKKAIQGVGKAISGVVKGVVKAVSSVVKAVVDIAASVVNFIAQPFMGLFGGFGGMPDAASEAERQQGVLVQRQGSNSNIPVVYGYRKVGGVVTYAETGSNNNKYLYVAYVFSEGVVEGLREVYIDDWQLPVNLTGQLNAGELVTVNADRYKDRVQLQWYPGVYFNNPSRSPVGTSVKNGIFAEAPSFTSDMIYNGLAVLFARYEWKEIKTQEDADNNPFGGSIPNVQVGMLGRRVASLLVDTEDTLYDSAPVRYSTNPAEILLDYLRNPRYGKGLTNNDFEWDSWKRAARKCNQTVTYLTTKSDITGPILTSNIVVDTGSTIMNNTKMLLMGFRAYMPYVQGKYKLKIEDAGNAYDITSGVATIVATFTPENIVGNITYTGIERSNKYNVVAVNYVDPDEKFSVQQVIFPETQSERQVYIDRDGGRENKLEATFPTITNYAIAKDMARLLFNKSRRQETVSLTVTSQALEIEPGDNIRIQGNLLDFGTDPWRVVSMRVNDNMTVTLNCVSNPDDIYPYVRAGEEDIVLPTYVPKGSTIYFPSSENRPALGLVPPTKAVFPEDFTSTPSHPPATNPSQPGGGGVGGGTPPETPGPITPPEEPDVPTPTPVVPDNDVPEPPPPPPPFRATLTLAEVTVRKVDDNLFNYDLRFTQPDDGLYDHSIFWWRYDKFSAYREVRLDQIPGSGGDIFVSLGPLPRGIYEFITRSFASDGRASILIFEGNFSATPSLTQQGVFVGSGGGNPKQVTAGWELPAPETPPAPKYDDQIDFFNIQTSFSGGAPKDPRKMTVILRQVEDTRSTPINSNIKGVRIFYKLKSDTYYAYEDYNFASTYVPGSTVTFEMQADFGVRISPTQIIPNTNADALSQYTFLVRLLYNDGTPAEKQLGPFTARVEGLLGATATTQTFQNGTRDIPDDFVIQTTDQDPQKGYNSSLEIIPNINTIIPGLTESTVKFLFNEPPVSLASNFAGFKIRFRPITPGEKPEFTTVTIGPGTNTFGRIEYTLQNADYSHNANYEFVITAQAIVSGARTDATTSLYAQKVNIPFNWRNDAVRLFNFEEKNTEDALRLLKTAFPGEPITNVVKWLKIQNKKARFESESTVYRKDSLNYYTNIYYQAHIQTPNDDDVLVVYRRQFDNTTTSGIGKTSTDRFAKYYNVGPWDKTEIDLSTISANGEGVKVLNFRGAVSSEYFDKNYESSPSNNQLVARKYGESGTWPYNNAPDEQTGIYPYAGDLNPSVTSETWTQYYLVLKIDGVEEDKGVMLRDFNTVKTGSNYQKTQDGFGIGNVPRDVTINKSEFETIESGYGRRLSEALDGSLIAISDFDTILVGARLPRGSDPNYITTPYTVFLQGPENGEDIY